MSKLIEEIINKTHEYLQPNPATRARLATLSTFNKIQGKVKAAPYPQPEGQLGECMLKYGNDLGQDSIFGTFILVMNKPVFWVSFTFIIRYRFVCSLFLIIA